MIFDDNYIFFIRYIETENLQLILICKHFKFSFIKFKAKKTLVDELMGTQDKNR